MPTLKQKFIGFLKQGISPNQLALAIALGIVIGLIPLLGSTSLLCMGAAFCFRLNMAAIQTVNYLIYPLQLLLYIPFLKAGAYLANQSFDYSLSEITSMLSTDVWGTIKQFFVINVYALVVWVLLALPLYIILYFIFKNVFTRFAQALNKESKISNS